MRKYLITAVVAVTAMAVAAPIASAQAPTMDVSITPKKAGKKKKPKNSTIKLAIENPETNRTMTKLTITTAKTFKFSAKGLKRCNEATLEASGPSACPKASRVGKGIARAALGVTKPPAEQTPLTFDVTPVVLGAREVGFYLAAREVPVNVLAPGHIKGRKLTIEVPLIAQQPVPGTFAGLISLETTLKAKRKKNYLASTNGCKARKHKFSAVLTFRDNGATPAGTRSTRASASCKK